MKRIVLSILGMSLITVGSAGFSPYFHSAVPYAEASNTEKTITWDVAIDCNTWRNNLGISIFDMGPGDGFIANGKIFPAGTLPPGGNDPNAPGSIGSWVERGTMAATLAEIEAGKRPAFFATWYHMLNDGSVLVADGPHPEAGPMAVIGGMNGFSGAAGEISEVTIIGWNLTDCPNMRLTVNLKKQAPK